MARTQYLTVAVTGKRNFKCISFPSNKSVNIHYAFSVVLLILLMADAGHCLQCYTCLDLSCESPTMCNSIRTSMNIIFLPRRHHLEFNPNVTCPSASPLVNPASNSSWSPLSQECSKTDSLCLQSGIEIISTFNGRRNNLALEPHSEMKTRGILRACASRRFLLRMETETLEVEVRNVTLVNSSTSEPNDLYQIEHVFSHHYYIDAGHSDAHRCHEDNCNVKMEGSRSRATSPIWWNFKVAKLLSLGYPQYFQLQMVCLIVFFVCDY